MGAVFGQVLTRAIDFNELNYFCDIIIKPEFTVYFQSITLSAMTACRWARALCSLQLAMAHKMLTIC